ncbi:purine-nucleoside phosphorylase [Pisciglobus halotolerans]|uniref:Purine nucleoside phosphorylase n=1 Tax=Pisciglobus halotolerans TaxID=745365 RepID=A0A1I3CHM2_9LACT|nr:purine-nucleoside phosphorylase [Pisciglobus halotolerans]SFH73975.1 purine-nucleoside phosphorylase [Pisciglobus halotolerans]
MTTQIHEQIKEAASFIQQQGVEQPEIGLILGSGLGELGDEIENPVIIPYHLIPHFPVSTVSGHAGQLVYGVLGEKKVLVMQGRFHYYEGYQLGEVTFPVRVMKALGIHSIMVTNAAGGINEQFSPGDLMMITDQINFTGVNPLYGPNDEEMGPRFTDMSQAYDLVYQDVVRKVAKEENIHLQEGVYIGFSGPTYETPAEIKMVRNWGADAVGMSTVPEVIVANHAGLRVVGISCITNLAAGMQKELNHEEVVETTTRVKEEFKRFVKSILKNM